MRDYENNCSAETEVPLAFFLTSKLLSTNAYRIGLMTGSLLLLCCEAICMDTVLSQKAQLHGYILCS